MHRLTLLLFLTVLASAGASAFDELRLDLGPTDSPVAPGWQALTPADAYSPERGWGWEQAPDSAFCRDQHWRGELPPWHHWMRDLPVDPLTRDGIAAAQPAVLRVDVPPGRYVIRVWVGDYLEPATTQTVSVNGLVVAENVQAGVGGLWGQILRAAVRPVRRVVEAKEDALRLTFSAIQTPARVVAVQVRRYVPGFVRLQGAHVRWIGPPDAEAEAICDLLNQGQVEKARERIAALPDSGRQFRKACLWEALAGNMALTDPKEPVGPLEEALRILKRPVPGADPMAVAERRDLLSEFWTANRYLRLMSYERGYRLTKKNSYRLQQEALALAEGIRPIEPLYWQAALLRGRILYWQGRESGTKSEEATRLFEQLLAHFPQNRIVRIYAGQPVPPLKEYPTDIPGAPKWASVERAALASVLDVIRWWLKERQIETGELGGGWGDDVEILRTWGHIALALDIPWLNEGIARMADGVWNHEPGLKEYGYPAGLGDVEHHAEPMADTHPLALAINYGEPRFLERCLRCISNMERLWTIVTPRGHRHFRSYNFGGDVVDPNPGAGFDVPLNARATKPGLWALWYNGQPEVARLFREWGHAWVEDCRRTDGGKPAGALPAGVRATDDTFPNPWYALSYADIDNTAYARTLYDQLLGTWLVTGDEEMLVPMHDIMRLIQEEFRSVTLEQFVKGQPDYPKGSAQWIGRAYNHPWFLNVVWKWRLITGDRRYDEFLAAWPPNGSPAVRCLLGLPEEEKVLQSLERTAQRNAASFEMITSEVLCTDRVSLGGTELLYTLYAGGFGDLSGCPGYAVRWENAGEDLAAWVLEATRSRFRARVYSFAPGAKRYAMQHWRLTPGRYRLSVRDDLPNGPFLERRQVVLRHRGDAIPLVLPARRALVVEMSQEQVLPWDPARLPDLAADRSPASPVGQPVQWTVYNLGCVPARDVVVQLRTDGRVVEQRRLALVPPARQYQLGRTRVSFRYRRGTTPLALVLDPEDRIAEITERNNRTDGVALSVRAIRAESRTAKKARPYS